VVLQERNPEAPFFDYRTQAPGTSQQITIADLPVPYSPPVDWQYRPALPSTWPQVPDGFTIDQYVTGLSELRYMKRAPNGDVFITESSAGRIKVLRATPGQETPQIETFATGLLLPFGIAFYPLGPEPSFVYVANVNSIVRFAYVNGDLHARGPAETIVPHAVAADGSLLVADDLANIIWRVRAAGVRLEF
jgi:glucose/arabinose dehydrogenase